MSNKLLKKYLVQKRILNQIQPKDEDFYDDDDDYDGFRDDNDTPREIPLEDLKKEVEDSAEISILCIIMCEKIAWYDKIIAYLIGDV